jgi:diguanylate cyclase (GGDEF)-like protein
MSTQKADQEYLLETITNYVHDCQDLKQILDKIATETRTFLAVDRVKIYQFAEDGSGEVVAESVLTERLPSLKGLHFPATDIPAVARQQFKETIHGMIIDVTAKRKTVNIKQNPKKTGGDSFYQQVDDCHLQYLLTMGVLSSVSIPILYWDDLWGLLVAHHSEPKRFTPQELQTVELISKQISLALAQKILLTQAQEQRQQELVITKIEQFLEKNHIEGEVWLEILEEIVRSLAADGGYLYLTPQLTGEPAQVYSCGLQPEFEDGEADYQWRELLKGREIIPTKNTLKSEDENFQFKIIPSIYVLTDFDADSPLRIALSKKSLQSLLLIPLRSRNQWIGCLTLFRQEKQWEKLWAGYHNEDFRNKLPRQSFTTWCEIQKYAPVWTQGDLNLAQTLGSHLYVAVTQKRLTSLIHHQASYDVLTQLPSPILFNQRLSLALVETKHQGEMLTLIMLGIDKFKRINDALGHSVGDYLLREVTERLQNSLEKENLTNIVLARWHGDGFTILVPNLSYTDEAIMLSEKLLNCFKEAFYVQSKTINLTASIGIAFAPYDGDNGETLLKNVETAMYAAKKQGKNSYQLYTPEMNLHNLNKLSLEIDLSKAIERNELLLYYQPQVEMLTGKILGVEALIRWQHPRLGLVPPNEFISIAEETGLINEIGEWVLKTACEQLQGWKLANFLPLKMSVNLSPLQLKQENLQYQILKIIQETNINPNNLCLELTETAVMQNVQGAIKLLTELKEIGVTIALDDFGIGYSSLSMLKNFPVDVLKIDKSFVQDLMIDPSNAGLCQGIITLAKGLNLKVLAEGIENREQWSFLHSINCDQAQGYLISRPLPPETLTSFLLKYKPISLHNNVEEKLSYNLEDSSQNTSKISANIQTEITIAQTEIEDNLLEYIQIKEELKQQASRERIVMNIAHKIRQSLKLSDILNTTVTEVRHLINADRVFLFRFNENWLGEVVVESVINPEFSILGEWIDEPCFREKYVKFYRQGRVKATNDIMTAELAPCHRELLVKYHVKSNLVLPVVYQDKLWGLMIAHQCQDFKEWKAHEVTLLSQIATQAAIAIHQGELYDQLSNANLELQKLSALDGLTQIPNRYRFDQYFAQEWQRAIRGREHLSLILCDVDHFKWYNDTYGHQSGDRCLQQVAATMSKIVQRPGDLVARYGGEEFVILLPNTNEKGAFHIAEKVRQEVQNLALPHLKSPLKCVTLSLGLATFLPNASMSSHALVHAADEALYQAKAQGRNQVVIYN